MALSFPFVMAAAEEEEGVPFPLAFERVDDIW
jgi:hypothetical protein